MITEDEIRSRLPIDRSRLDDELELHSQVAEQISRKVAKLEHETAIAKDDLGRCEAGLTIDYSAEEGKQTKAEIEARVIRASVRREALKVHLSLVEQLTTWKGLQEAWRDKKFSMRTLADLYSSNYFDSASVVTARRQRTEERDTSYRDRLPPRRADSVRDASDAIEAEEQPLRRRMPR